GECRRPGGPGVAETAGGRVTLSDQSGRDSIATDLDVSMMVEAAAGTGKTTSLVTRAVRLIRTGRCSISSLAAITFTVKAAAQLRERLQEGLERELSTKQAAAAGGESVSVQRERVRHA